MKKILLAVPNHSSFKIPLLNAFQELGFEVKCFDFRFFIKNIRLDNSFILSIFQLVTLLYYKMFRKEIFQSKHTLLMNKLFIEMAYNFKTDLIFVVKGENIQASTINSLKKKRIKTIIWMVDPVIFNKDHWFMKVAPSYDVVLPFEEGIIHKLKKLNWGNTIVHMMAAANRIDYQLKSKKIYDVVFVGTHSLYREKLFTKLLKFNFTIWGYGWQNSSLSNIYKGPLSYNKLLNVYSKSKIAIATAQTPLVSVTNRVFEVAESGSLVITNYNKYIKTAFEVNREIICFHSSKDLINKIDYYLKNTKQRETVIKRMQKKIARSHTYKIRIKEVFRNSDLAIPN